MRNLYLVQPNYGTGSGEFTSHWLPYSVGCLWAYARQFEDITTSYALRGLFFRRTPIEEVVGGMNEPAVVGFSNYVWNANYNRALARRIKETWPAAVIVFGGPEVPNDPAGLFAADPFVDVTVHQEAELTFTRLLRALNEERRDLTGIPGIAFVDRRGAVVRNPGGGRIDALESLPSPYTTGVFDELVLGNTDVKWAATYETNRGCPFKCHFCDWGSAIFSKIKRFPEERARGELDWFAANRVEYVFVADANFGILRQRDDAIADYVLEVVRRTGYPKTFCIQWTKDSNEDVVRMARKLSSVQKGLTLSVQSMSDAVLGAVERRNLAIHNLSDILAICNRENLPSYTELILGLPEETLGSWKEGLHRLLDLGQHCAIDVWIAQVLRNSALNDPAEITRYGIETVAAKDYLTGARAGPAAAGTEIAEEIRLVRSTKSMPFDDLIDAYMYAWMIVNFHLYGWTQLSARILNVHGGVSYREQYPRLFEFIRSRTRGLIHDEFESTRRRIREYMSAGEIRGNLRDEIGLDLEISGHNLMWLSQMVFRARGREFFAELRPFCDSIGQGLPEPIRNDLRVAQENALVFYGERYPREFKIGSNLIDAAFHGYALSADRECRYRADYRKEVRELAVDVERMSETDFLYMLYYKRRISPGTTDIVRVG
jgi:hypothetical protein